jgi:hypothetical protein
MDAVIPHRFGALPPLPPGYSVDWYECHEHYQATGPDDWESAITVDPFQARRWCFAHAERAANARANV